MGLRTSAFFRDIHENIDGDGDPKTDTCTWLEIHVSQRKISHTKATVDVGLDKPQDCCEETFVKQYGANTADKWGKDCIGAVEKQSEATVVKSRYINAINTTLVRKFLCLEGTMDIHGDVSANDCVGLHGLREMTSTIFQRRHVIYMFRINLSGSWNFGKSTAKEYMYHGSYTRTSRAQHGGTLVRTDKMERTRWYRKTDEVEGLRQKVNEGSSEIDASSSVRMVTRNGMGIMYLLREVYNRKRWSTCSTRLAVVLEKVNNCAWLILSVQAVLFFFFPFFEVLESSSQADNCFPKKDTLLFRGETDNSFLKEEGRVRCPLYAVAWAVLLVLMMTIICLCLTMNNQGKMQPLVKNALSCESAEKDTSDCAEKSFPGKPGRQCKWYLDWFPQSVAKLHVNICACPASHDWPLEHYFDRKFSSEGLSEKEEMRYEWLRLQSFQNWPTWAVPYPSHLAKAGFYYKKQGDKVSCFSCGGTVENWRPGHVPMEIHRTHFPDCKFVTGEEQNYPISPVDSSTVSPAVSEMLARTSITPAPEETTPRGVAESVDSHTATTNQPDNVIGATTTPSSVPQTPSSVQAASDSGNSSSARSSSSGIDDIFIERMKHEHNRYLTYRRWPTGDYVQPRALATAGFYYTGLGQKVKCAFCAGVVDFVQPNQDPMACHRRLFPTCPFVLSPNTVNIPVYPPTATTRAPAAPTPPQTDLAMLGIMSDSPKHPEFSLLQARINSFRGWSPEREQRPYELAVAGFIYAGMIDCVKCFQCDGGLRNWLPGDIPWVEHARWFPQCSHVRLCKGQEFIDTIEEQYPRQSAATSETASTSTGRIERLMSSSAVQAVVEMGYSTQIVRRGLEEYVRQKGSESGLSAQALVEILLEIPSEGGDPPVETNTSQSNTAQGGSHEAAARSNTPVIDESEIGEELDTKSLREKNRELVEQTLCKICLENKMCITFLPCGHLVSCAECAPALRKCPICRSTIKGRVRVYMS